jgi:hypothetical protein
MHFALIGNNPVEVQSKQPIILKSERIVHRESLIDWIQRKQESRKWKPRRNKS